MKKTLLILMLLLVGLSVSAKKRSSAKNNKKTVDLTTPYGPVHGAIDKNIKIFNEIADSLLSMYPLDFKDADSAKMLKGFTVIIDPIYRPKSREIDKVLIFARPFVGSQEMVGYARELELDEVPCTILASRDSIHYYFSGTAPDFFATPVFERIDKFVASYVRIECKVRANRRAKERVRIMALPADNEERIKLEKKEAEDKEYEERVKERERRGDDHWFDDYGMFERYDFTEHLFSAKLRDYKSFILYKTINSKGEYTGWILD